MWVENWLVWHVISWRCQWAFVINPWRGEQLQLKKRMNAKGGWPLPDPCSHIDAEMFQVCRVWHCVCLASSSLRLGDYNHTVQSMDLLQNRNDDYKQSYSVHKLQRSMSQDYNEQDNVSNSTLRKQMLSWIRIRRAAQLTKFWFQLNRRNYLSMMEKM